MAARLARLAVRNLMRYSRRSLLTGSVMAFSVAAIIFAAAMGEAFYNQLVNVGIKTATGHVQVYPRGWDMDIISPMSGDIPKLDDSATIERIVSRAPHYEAHGREILYQVLLYDHTDNYYAASVVGIEAQTMAATLPGLKLLVGDDGSSMATKLEDGILISAHMRQHFRPQLQDMMYIIIGGPSGMMEGIKTRYRGVVASMPLFADRVAYVGLATMQTLLDWEADEVCTIKVIVDDKNNAEACAAWLRQELSRNGADVQVKTWKDLGGFYFHIALLGRVLVAILLVILAAITAISVSNTMLISVKERTREIGTIMALGLKRARVVHLFLLESFILAVCSSLVGGIAGSALVVWFRERGIVNGLALVLEGKLYPVLQLYPVLFSFLWILLIGTASGLYPAYRGSRLDPIEALRCL
jgi:putative ABC transport system permease protein